MKERRVMKNYSGRYPEEGETREEMCERCGHVGLEESDGFYYCQCCEAQAPDMIVTLLQNDFYISPNGRRRRLYDPCCPPSFLSDNDDETLKLEDCWKVVRERYVRGLRLTLQMQTRALMEVHKVDFKVRRVADVILLKYLTRKGIIHQHSSDGEMIILDPHVPPSPDQEADCINERVSKKPRLAETSTDAEDPELIKRECMRRLKKLSEALPMSTTLVVSFVACHELREPVLPTDILNWALHGTLPFLDAHVRIENCNKALSSGLPQPCPISYIEMFGPRQGLFIKSANKLEPMAAALASEIRMYTPPVNFQLIASRFLTQLDIPRDLESILKYAIRLYDWFAPPELWLSTNEAALPTRVAVMSMLIASMAYLYDLAEVSGMWERSLSKSGSCHRPAGKGVNLSLTSEELLTHLEAAHSKIRLSSEYLKDVSTYRKYTDEMGFAGWNEEEELIGNFLGYYLDDQDPVTSDRDEFRISSGISWRIPNARKKETENSLGSKRIKRSRGGKPKDKGKNTPSSSRHEPGYSSNKGMTLKDKVICNLKAEMEENDFYYVLPGNLQGQGYIYRMREEKGTSTFPADSDYYIMLRACAVVAKVDVRVMHLGVRSFARRVAKVNQDLYVLEILSRMHS